MFTRRDQGHPTFSWQVTDGMLEAVLEEAIDGCSYWCREIRITRAPTAPAQPTPAQAGALQDDSTAPGDGPQLLRATWVWTPFEEQVPGARLSMARLRETVAQVFCHEAARGRLASGDSGRPALNAQQADVAVQLALFSEIVFG